MQLIAFVCFVFAVVDYMGMQLGYDLTGVSWSPVVAMLLGSALLRIAD